MRTTRRSDSPLYKRHHQFLSGCTNPQSYAWKHYGSRGITIYKPWASLKVGFDRFEEWILSNLGPIPFPGAVIRRINSNKGIQPGNLEWSTRRIVSNHRSSNHKIRIGGQTKSLADWCRVYNKNLRTVWSRIHDYGMKPKAALEK